MPTDSYSMKIESSQIAIAGRVLRGGNPISGAIVEIESSPESFQAILSMKAMKYGSQWENMSDRPDRKKTASDGYFFFVNLPDGSYSLKVYKPGRFKDLDENDKPEKKDHNFNVTRVLIPDNPAGYYRIVTKFKDIDLDPEE